MRRWLYSTNAKDIGTLYIIFAIIAGLIGTSMSMVMRMELGGTGNNIISNNQTYNILITAHGFLMIFYLIMPALLGGFGNILYCGEGLKGYLAGLIEGDGSIIVPKEGGRYNNPRIGVVFNEKDKKLAEKLKEKLEVGEINKGEGRFYLLQIRRKDDLKKIVKLINGNMRTPKIEALERLIKWLNKRSEEKIEFKGLDRSILSNSGWFSGFSDADSKFSVTIQERKGKVARIRGYYRLELRQKYHREVSKELGGSSYINIMLEIGEYFGVNVLSRRRSIGEAVYESYMLMLTRKDSILKLEEYLNNYPLYSSKFLDYKDWKDLLNIVEKGDHKSKEGLENCKRLKSGINKGRIRFNWDHLEKLGQ